ncbi:hypothetical protein O181_025038 [Austropuccinia psidii MF-1]|uniref:Uncharacterized protein n=1 Tax=Austropuccinia psidii MF-1 TaxID=1389203 RepID=A0A9Q3CLX6_9BASI|nr:hypothetical protein [Austropuccinia psidii MF-1]
MKNDSILKDLLEDFKEAQYGTKLMTKMKISLLKILRKHRESCAIGNEPPSKIKGNDIELNLEVERPFPPFLRKQPYLESLETRKDIDKHINEPLEMGVIRKIGHIEIVEVTTLVLITCNDGKYRPCEDSRALNN